MHAGSLILRLRHEAKDYNDTAEATMFVDFFMFVKHGDPTTE